MEPRQTACVCAGSLHDDVVDDLHEELSQLDYARVADEFEKFACHADVYERMRDLVLEHSLRMQLINKASATLAFARWGHPYETRLTLDQIAQLTGRAKSTVAADLKRIAQVLDVLDDHPHLPPELWFDLRDQGFSLAEVSFLFALDVTTSPTRAAELSGHGTACPSATRDRLMRRLQELAEQDSLGAVRVRFLLAVRGAFARRGKRAGGSSALGKRRSDLSPRSNAPIPWLDDIDEPDSEEYRQLVSSFHVERLQAMVDAATGD